jgi:hypothetical protein
MRFKNPILAEILEYVGLLGGLKNRIRSATQINIMREDKYT